MKKKKMMMMGVYLLHCCDLFYIMGASLIARVVTVVGVVGTSVAFAGIMMARSVIFVVARDNLEE